jgi:hypothetical protein
MRLLIEVLRGKKIRNVTWVTAPAPYIVISYGNEAFKTKVAKKVVMDEMIWSENFAADFSAGLSELTVEIWQGGFGGVGDSLIAKGNVRLSELHDSRRDRRWCEAFYRHRGEELSAGLIEIQLMLFETQALLEEFRESARLNDASEAIAAAGSVQMEISKNATEQGLRISHWLHDTKTNECFWPACPVVFGPFNRRHHCRMCGLIFCASHAASKRRIDRSALPCHDGPFLVRVCDGCAQIGASAMASEEIHRLRTEFVAVHFQTLSHMRPDGAPTRAHSAADGAPSQSHVHAADRALPPLDQPLLSPTADRRAQIAPAPRADGAPTAVHRGYTPAPPMGPPPGIAAHAGGPHYPGHQNAHNAHAAMAGGNTFFGSAPHVAPHAHALAEAWRGCWDAQSGRAYFWNTLSGEVSWSHPSSQDGAALAASTRPDRLALEEQARLQQQREAELQARLGQLRLEAEAEERERVRLEAESERAGRCAPMHAVDYATAQGRPCSGTTTNPVADQPAIGRASVDSTGAHGSVDVWPLPGLASADTDGFVPRQQARRDRADQPEQLHTTRLPISPAPASAVVSLAVPPSCNTPAAGVPPLTPVSAAARLSSASSGTLDDDDFFQQLTQIHDRWLGSFTQAVNQAEPLDSAQYESIAHGQPIADGHADASLDGHDRQDDVMASAGRHSNDAKLWSCVCEGDAQGVTTLLALGADANFTSPANNQDRWLIASAADATLRELLACARDGVIRLSRETPRASVVSSFTLLDVAQRRA